MPAPHQHHWVVGGGAAWHAVQLAALQALQVRQLEQQAQEGEQGKARAG